jgi:hypothetical protein
VIYIVFDIFHDSYEPDLAHLMEHNSLPVIVVRFSRQVTVTSVSDNLRARVNREVASAHNFNGKNSRPPFLEDHTDGKIPEYKEPRNASSLLEEQ